MFFFNIIVMLNLRIMNDQKFLLYELRYGNNHFGGDVISSELTKSFVMSDIIYISK